MNVKEFEIAQLKFCKEQSHGCAVTKGDEKLGIALKTIGKLPINGLRNNPVSDTCGWYVWCGEDFSEDDEFFEPLHAYHLTEYCPEIIRLLGLPPGHRFLLAGEHLDIWFDESLLYDD